MQVLFTSGDRICQRRNMILSHSIQARAKTSTYPQYMEMTVMAFFIFPTVITACGGYNIKGG